MITKLAKICLPCSFILTFIISYLIGKRVIFSLILSIIVFISVLLFFCALIIILLIILGKKYAKTYDPKDEKRWRFMNDVAAFSCWGLGLKIHTEGLELIPEDEPIVFYSNHQGFLDMFIYDNVLKNHKRASMYKIEHTKNPLISGMVKSLGGVAIDRNNDRQAALGVIEIIKEVKTGVNFMIYPEGTRSKGVGMNDYHAGSFKVAQKSGASLVALALDGAYKKGCFIPFIPVHVYVGVVKVMTNEEVNLYNTNDLAKEIHDLTLEKINTARKEIKHL